MKAAELIRVLQELVDEFGDQEVRIMAQLPSVEEHVHLVNFTFNDDESEAFFLLEKDTGRYGP